MRKRKDVEIDGKTITVRELTVEEVMLFGQDLFSLSERFNFGGALTNAMKILEATTTLKNEDIRKLSFSELEVLEATWKEVNAPFLRRYRQVIDLITKAGLKEAAIQIGETIKKEFLKQVEKTLSTSLPSSAQS